MANKTAEIYNFVAKLYQTELQDIAEKLEKKRKIYSLVHKIVTVIAVLVTLGVAFWIISYASNAHTANGIRISYGPEMWLYSVFCVVSIFIFMWGLRTIVFNHYAKEVKEKLFSKIYTAIDKNLIYTPGKFKLPIYLFGIELFFDIYRDGRVDTLLAESQLKKLNPVLPDYDYMRIDDIITGSYLGREVLIVEFSLIRKQVYYGERGRRRVEYTEVFHGALFKTTMEKKLKAEVLVKQKASGLKCPPGLHDVNLESNEFEKMYEVFSSDQIESRYFLNTSTMENFIDLNNSGQKVSCYVKGNNVNILIHTSEDMFEPDIDKPLNNPNNYFDIIFQAKIILDIITRLNLESKTGL